MLQALLDEGSWTASAEADPDGNGDEPPQGETGGDAGSDAGSDPEPPDDAAPEPGRDESAVSVEDEAKDQDEAKPADEAEVRTRPRWFRYRPSRCSRCSRRARAFEGPGGRVGR